MTSVENGLQNMYHKAHSMHVQLYQVIASFDGFDVNWNSQFAVRCKGYLCIESFWHIWGMCVL